MEIKFYQIILVVFSLKIIYAQQCCEYSCYAEERKPKIVKQFSTLTYYGNNYSKIKRNYTIAGCTPIKFWMLARHGTQLPYAREFLKLKKLKQFRDLISENYFRRNNGPDNGPMCDADLNLLKKWEWDEDITEKVEQHLTTNGYNELKNLAKRYQKAFPNLLSNYSENKFVFRHTATQKTEASFRAFVDGLWGSNFIQNVTKKEIPAKDSLLRLYHHCNEWNLHAQNLNTSNNTEVFSFQKSFIFKKLLKDVKIKLGFGYEITVEQINNMWDMCRYDQAWDLSLKSPFCAVFTPSQVEVLEYMEDLKDYYKSGYGSPINDKMACSTINDMLTHLNRNDTEDPSVVAYFSHSEMIHTFLVGLNAFKDSFEIRAHNYDSYHAKRKWRTSILGPFAANILAVKYDCPKEPLRYKTKIFLNEKPIEFDWCKSDGLCDWNVMKEKYQRFDNAECFTNFCTLSLGILHKASIILIGLQTIYFIFF